MGTTPQAEPGPPGRWRPGRRVRSAGVAGAAALGELVLHGRGAALGALGGQLGERALDLAPHPADGDAEHALATLDQVDDLVGARALVHARAVAHQGDPGEVVHATLVQVVDGGADLLQRHPGVEQPLDHLEHEDVAETVQALGPGPAGAADARLDQPRAGPVVELAVGDAGGPAGRRTPVAGLGVEVGP